MAARARHQRLRRQSPEEALYDDILSAPSSVVELQIEYRRTINTNPSSCNLTNCQGCQGCGAGQSDEYCPCSSSSTPLQTSSSSEASNTATPSPSTSVVPPSTTSSKLASSSSSVTAGSSTTTTPDRSTSNHSNQCIKSESCGSTTPPPSSTTSLSVTPSPSLLPATSSSYSRTQDASSIPDGASPMTGLMPTQTGSELSEHASSRELPPGSLSAIVVTVVSAVVLCATVLWYRKRRRAISWAFIGELQNDQCSEVSRGSLSSWWSIRFGGVPARNGTAASM
ncbi:hypothetical protein C8Q80DRAFT_447001 [Daedaleopsis nitida]|nr:hypothetical protein C8Q80DRAFT_447001 [Daedaleopsis nitida]